MLENIYILTEEGICLFHHHAPGAMEFDENLVGAFLTALNQFSKETFADSSMEKVDVSNHKKIIVYNPRVDKKVPEIGENEKTVRIYAIVHRADHEKLVKHFLRSMYTRFMKLHGERILEGKVHDVASFERFSVEVEGSLNMRVYRRSKKREFAGLLLAAAILTTAMLLLGMFAFFRQDIAQARFEQFLTDQGLLAAFVAFSLLLNLILGVACVAGGFIGGSRKKGIRNGIRLGVITFLLIALVSIRNGLGFFMLSAFVVVYFGFNAVAMFYFGGFLRDRAFLYTIEQ